MLEAGPMPIGIFVESFNSDSTIQQSLSATARLSSCWMSKLDANFCYIIYLPSFQWSTNSTKRKWCPSTSSRATRLFSNATFPHSSQISSKWMPGWRLMARSICRGPTSVLVTSVDPNHICTIHPPISITYSSDAPSLLTLNSLFCCLKFSLWFVYPHIPFCLLLSSTHRPCFTLSIQFYLS